MNQKVAATVFVGLLLPGLCWATDDMGRPNTTQEQQADINFDQLVTACRHAAKRDQICNLLVQIKQVGDDAVEAVKDFIPLGPAEYAALTAMNAITTGRLRVRSKSLIFKNWDSVLDFQKDGTYLIQLERDF